MLKANETGNSPYALASKLLAVLLPLSIGCMRKALTMSAPGTSASRRDAPDHSRVGTGSAVTHQTDGVQAALDRLADAARGQGCAKAA